MIVFKEGVRFDGVRQIITDTLPEIEEAYAEAGYDTVTVTCGTEGHINDDPHTHGFALDFRTKNIATLEEKQAIVAAIRQKCGRLYYAFLEDAGGNNEHIHFQVRKDLWRTML